MPLLKINSNCLDPHPDDGRSLDASLDHALTQIGPDAPVVVMVHGYRFSPFVPGASPHEHILSPDPRPGCRKAVPWPRRLGLDRDRGLGIAFGWHARGSIWEAWQEAERAGTALARLIDAVTARRRGRVDIIAHSLGARVALAALREARPRTVGRAILVAAAEYRGTAEATLATAGGHTAEIFNVTSRENDLFDRLMEGFLGRAPFADRALGAGLGRPARNWLDLAIDDPATRAALTALGHHVPAPGRRVCHWSGYLRPGLLEFYAALLHDREMLPLALLRDRLPAERPRRSPWPPVRLPVQRPLPFRRGASF